MLKLETKADVPEDTNALALQTFDALAAQVRKDNPSLTKEMAFEKVYSDPKHADLRRLERNSFYKNINYDCRYEQPVAKSTPVEESGAGYQTVMKLAEAAHKKDPSESIAQHFSKIYSSREDLRRQDISERNIAKAGYPGYAQTEPEDVTDDVASGAYGKLSALADRERERFPFLTQAQAFARIYSDPSNKELATQDRAERYERMIGAGVCQPLA